MTPAALRRSLGARLMAGIAAAAAITVVVAVVLIGAFAEQRDAAGEAAGADRALLAISAIERDAAELTARPGGGGPLGDIAVSVEELRGLLEELGVDPEEARTLTNRLTTEAEALASAAPGEEEAAMSRLLADLAALEIRVVDEAEAARADAADAVDAATLLTALAGALVLALLALLGLWLRRAVMRPVAALSGAAERIAAGELSERVAEPAGEDEIARMTRSFNRMAESLEEALAESRGAERMREEFFALVSHELRTPLTSIVGYVELLAEDASGVEALSAEERRRFIGIVDRNSRHLLSLVGDLLLAAQIEEGQMVLDRRRFDLSRVARDAVEAAAPAARLDRISLATAIEGPIEVDADPNRISQAIGNLLSNAIKFTPAGGEVGIEVTVPLGERPTVVRIEIWDTGVGLSEAERERLFERFYRAPGARSSETPGIGLGLVITRAIIEAHGGTLEVESVEGGGSTFRCLLPLD